MADTKEDGRYYPDEKEQQILISYLKVYFSHPERSNERKQICLETCKLLQQEKGGNHWTERSTRLWFNNNKNIYLARDPPRITTAHTQPIQPIDPNLSLLSPTINDRKSVMFGFENNTNLFPTSSLNNQNSNLGDIDSLKSGYSSQSLATSSNQNTINSEMPSILHSPMNPSINSLNDMSTSNSTDISRTNSNSSSVSFRNFMDNSEFSRAETPEMLRISSLHSQTISSEQDLEIPPIPSTSLTDFDTMKYQHYQYLQALYAIFSKSSFLANGDRLKKQQEVENSFEIVLRQFHENLNINHVLSNDSTALVVKALRPTNLEIPRAPSATTAAYAASRKPQMASHIQTGPGIYFPSTIHFPDASPGLQALFRGESCPTSFPLSPLCQPYAFCFDSLGILYYCTFSNGCFELRALGSRPSMTYPTFGKDTGFISAPTSMIADESTVWIAGDCRVIGFDKLDFHLVEIFSLNNEHIKTETTIALSRSDEIVLGFDDTILIWSKLENKTPLTKSLKKDLFEKEANRNGIKNPNWSAGVKTKITSFSCSGLKRINSILVIYDLVIVASDSHHAIHILDKKGQFVSRLSGHTGGVTVLAEGITDNRFYSGSEDWTVREWNLDNMRVEKIFEGHPDTISHINAGKWEGASLVFSSDGAPTIRSWSEDKNQPLFEARLENKSALGLKFVPEHKILLALLAENSGNLDVKSEYTLLEYKFNDQ